MGTFVTGLGHFLKFEKNRHMAARKLRFSFTLKPWFSVDTKGLQTFCSNKFVISNHTTAPLCVLYGPVKGYSHCWVHTEELKNREPCSITKNRPHDRVAGRQLEGHCPTAQTTAQSTTQQRCRRAVWHAAWPKQHNAPAFKRRTNNLVTN